MFGYHDVHDMTITVSLYINADVYSVEIRLLELCTVRYGDQSPNMVFQIALS